MQMAKNLQASSSRLQDIEGACDADCRQIPESMSWAKISLVLTCYRAQYPVAIYARRERAKCPRRHSHPDSISIYSRSIPEIEKKHIVKQWYTHGTTKDVTMRWVIIYARLP